LGLERAEALRRIREEWPASTEILRRDAFRNLFERERSLAEIRDKPQPVLVPLAREWLRTQKKAEPLDDEHEDGSSWRGGPPARGP
jgi:hypothetical protein